RMPERDVESVARLPLQIRIPDLEGRVARVRSEIVELLQRRSAVGMAVVSCEGPALPDPGPEADRARGAVERPIGHGPVRERRRVVAVVLEPAAELEGHVLEVDLLEHEESKGILQRRRRERLGTRGGVVPMESPEPEAARHAPSLPVVEHAAIVESFIGEPCVYVAGFGADLLVLIVVVLKRELRAAEEGLEVAKSAVEPDAVAARVQ